MSNIAKIKEFDIADGPGVRVGVFLSGCPHHCPGCFNQELWDYNYGKPFDTDDSKKIKELLSRPYISGISILGGEPLCDENLCVTCWLIDIAHELGKNVWIYTGYTFDELLKRVIEVPTNVFLCIALKEVDILVDGRFEQSLADKRLQFRGSSNQRIIDMKKTIKAVSVVLWNGGDYQ
jgi:anaerobic ribonucleoside-triphosphate reductase activating protein